MKEGSDTKSVRVFFYCDDKFLGFNGIKPDNNIALTHSKCQKDPVQKGGFEIMIIDIGEILKVVFLGIVEGITEWLPISSTGHMLLVDEFITLNMSEAFKEMFFVVIQLGAIFSVVIMFWNKMFPFQFKDKSQAFVREESLSLWL